MKILSTLKLLAATVLAVAIFYVGGTASMQALRYYGNFDWAIITAAFWLGGLLMVVIVAECVKRIIVAVASVIEDEEAPMSAPAEHEDEEDSRPTRAAAKPGPGTAPKPPSPALKPAAAQAPAPAKPAQPGQAAAAPAKK